MRTTAPPISSSIPAPSASRQRGSDQGGDPGSEAAAVIGPSGAVRVMVATRPSEPRWRERRCGRPRHRSRVRSRRRPPLARATASVTPMTFVPATTPAASALPSVPSPMRSPERAADGAAGTKVIGVGSCAASRARRASRRQPNTCWGVTPWRRAMLVSGLEHRCEPRRLEVITGGSGRRVWSADAKAAILGSPRGSLPWHPPTKPAARCRP
jgi:hypothetical protein